jgi:hypothetical protein
MTKYLLSIVLAVLCSSALAEVKVYPPADQAIGAVTSETIGRWVVFRAAPFGVVASQPITLGGDPGCMWTGDAGTYTAVLVPDDTGAGIETGTVVLGGGVKPEPDPAPEPKPEPDPPGPRKVIVIAEEDNQTAYREVAIDALREYALDNDHEYRLFDPNEKDSSGGTPPLLEEYLREAESVGLPAILVIDRKGEVAVAKFPDAGRTVVSAKTAGNKAIAVVKESGG